MIVKFLGTTFRIIYETFYRISVLMAHWSFFVSKNGVFIDKQACLVENLPRVAQHSHICRRWGRSRGWSGHWSGAASASRPGRTATGSRTAPTPALSARNMAWSPAPRRPTSGWSSGDMWCGGVMFQPSQVGCHRYFIEDLEVHEWFWLQTLHE